MIFEFSHANPILERMQKHCPHAGEFMHSDSLTPPERMVESSLSFFADRNHRKMDVCTAEIITFVFVQAFCCNGLPCREDVRSITCNVCR